MSSLPPIDMQAIENLRALNPGDNDEFLREIVGIFLEDTPQRIIDLEQSLVVGDIGKFTRAAHSIKGSSANLGAQPLRMAGEKLEDHSRKLGLAGVDGMIGIIKEEFSRAKLELEKIACLS